jgi:ribose 1,5-bisphosphokinase
MKGRLIYLMGPSGAGKDSVLRYARARLDRRCNLAVAHRYITRPPDPRHENFISLSDAEFDLRLGKQLFLFDWNAHGLRYAVGTEVELWRAAGLAAVVSGSREHFVRAMQGFPGVLPILVDASPETRRQRLLARNRESAGDIDERLERAAALRIDHPALVAIDNSGALDVAGNRFLAVLLEAAATQGF